MEVLAIIFILMFFGLMIVLSFSSLYRNDSKILMEKEVRVINKAHYPDNYQDLIESARYHAVGYYGSRYYPRYIPEKFYVSFDFDNDILNIDNEEVYKLVKVDDLVKIKYYERIIFSFSRINKKIDIYSVIIDNQEIILQ